MIVIMQWNEPAQKWLMLNAHNNVFIYDFWDCGNVQVMFPGLDKEEAKKYKITVEER